MKIILKLIGLYFNIMTWVFPKMIARQSFNLFAYPFKAKLGPAQQEFLDTADKFKLDVNGKKVQYYKWGIGPEKVLLVHGWQSNTFRWKSYIESLGPNKYTIYCFDAPGHGNSEGRICNIPLYEKSIVSLIASVGDINHIVGHSIGSFSCASFMYHHNYSVESYTSLASPFSAYEFVDFYRNMINMSDRSYEYLADYFLHYTTYPVSHYSLEVFTTAINPNRTLIIHDEKDEMTPYDNAIGMERLMKKEGLCVELELTKGLYHSLRSKEVTQKVVEHIRNSNKHLN